MLLTLSREERHDCVYKYSIPLRVEVLLQWLRQGKSCTKKSWGRDQGFLRGDGGVSMRSGAYLVYFRSDLTIS